jgi:phosphoribosylanthranilate isomerase
MQKSISIKICGITNRADALLAAESGADALGFIGVLGTPRYVAPEAYRDIARNLPAGVKRVIVVHRPEDADGYAADSVQHYEEASDPFGLPCKDMKLIRAFRIRDQASLKALADYSLPHEAVLLDAYHQQKLGGSGEAFDWALAVQAKQLTAKPILLAGGLTPENVQQALDHVQPEGVDVSSGVEAQIGVKDPVKVRAFIAAVREWEEKR